MRKRLPLFRPKAKGVSIATTSLILVFGQHADMRVTAPARVIDTATAEAASSQLAN